jgi:PHP family Zn ribbon phosphoesterase
MLKSNGRLKPAGKIELSNIKGKSMYCSKCNKNYVVSKIEFANTKCEVCGEQLEDLNISNASKATGKQ